MERKENTEKIEEKRKKNIRKERKRKMKGEKRLEKLSFKNNFLDATMTMTMTGSK